ncbi:tetratricopeptide repeat protein [Vibrio rumoiensis]|uniref:Deca-heme c-type cytochrome n=1 Tax=Vibrio rumoiensis 1S-45 TaxID=1188252 RepID=A0A1E5E2D3_9VIBR|nr:tetratricopeptide repeat protein [Vibrio rumoiensis]OEF25592.1 hypothetical protein A1QC_01480 [Vibrio rumoiensis 1S-45]
MASFLLGMSAYAATPSEQCASCHQQQVDDWKQSDHFHAMEKATVKTSLGKFDGRSIEYLGKKATFSQDAQSRLWVDFVDEQGQTQHLQIEYTFGYQPLQQYMFNAGKGSKQFIPFAWDSRNKEEGGQRWFILHPDQAPNDTFHWTNKGQNWNQMCADCHSTDFEKNFNLETKSYQSTFSALNVSCNACHGDESQHLKWAKGDKSIANQGYDVNIKQQTPIFHKNAEGKMVSVQPLVPSKQVETCATCHARRAQLKDRVSPQDIVDAFQPSLITPELYYPDGQIADEVYVWGSFMQSKMHEKGVTCSNCHNPHSGKLKFTGNQTCTQCHSQPEYDTDKHHKHAKMSAGNQCVDCHMPSTTYMQVDPRRDHSFKVPRPDLTLSTDSPNACNACHQDKSVQWSVDTLKKWYPNSPYQGQSHFSMVFHNADNGLLRSSTELSKIAQDKNYPDIIRASALTRMATLPDANTVVAITRAIKEDEPLKRLGAIDAVENFPITQRWRLIHTLLADKNLSVRIEAARVLAPILVESPLTSGTTEDDRTQLNKVLDEYRQAQVYQADRGFSHVALGNLALSLKQLDKAEADFKQAINVEPIFIPAYVNLADVYRVKKEESKARDILEQGLKIAPENATLYYAKAMSYVRDGQKSKALEPLRHATHYAASNMQYHYTYSLLLKDVGKPKEAVEELVKAYELSSNNPDLAYAISQAYIELKDYSSALVYAKKLQQLVPNNPQVDGFVSQLMQMN